MGKSTHELAEERFTKNLGDLVIDYFQRAVDDDSFDLSLAMSALQSTYIDFWENDPTESPIERLLWSEILFANDGYHEVKLSSDNTKDGTYLFTQYPVEKYKADFMFCVNLLGHQQHLVIECDGHDFHERTKKQARHDKSRDRYFTKLGYKILRFTGSEIYENPAKCRHEIEQVLCNIVEEILVNIGVIRGPA